MTNTNELAENKRVRIIHEFNFEEWLNRWADADLHPEVKSENKKLSEYGKGYHQAIRDVADKLDLKFENDEWLKRNFIAIAKHHKENCNDASCNISLISLYLALKRLSTRPMSKKEIEVFL